MRFIPLAMVTIYFSVLSTFAQVTPKDSVSYYKRKLKVEEINFVSGYYNQDGNNSAVTGGIGTEQLTDLANVIDIKLSKYDKKYRKHSLNFELGVDHYTSASSANIGSHVGDEIMSAESRQDLRIYPSIRWSVQNEQKGTSFGLTGSESYEYDYLSYGAALDFSQLSKDKNREFSLKVQTFFDTWTVILPEELRPPGYGSGNVGDPTPVDHSPRNSFSLALSLSQVINARMQVLISLEPAYQHGLLATKYQRVYFVDGSEKVENLPDSRYKLPIGLRMNYFLGDRIIIRSFYRHYFDNWGVSANTVDLELPVKITPFFSISPFYRFHAQNGTTYFAPYAMHQVSDSFYTSDHDLSTLTSNFIGAGIKLTPPKGILGWSHLASMEFRYGYYAQSNGLNANSLGLALKFK